MLQEATPFQVPGLAKFNTIEGLRLYLKGLMRHYERESDRYGEKVGYLMRILDSQAKGTQAQALREIEWRKVGMVMVNTKEPNRGTLEVMIEAMEDFKAKAIRTGDVLQNIDELENLGIPEGAAILVYLRHGVPLRIVIDGQRNRDVDALIEATS
jgi:hypothetical protein